MLLNSYSPLCLRLYPIHDKNRVKRVHFVLVSIFDAYYSMLSSLTRFIGYPSDANTITDRKALEESWTCLGQNTWNKMRNTGRYVGRGSIGSISGTADGGHAELSTDEYILHLEREARTVCSLQSPMAQEVC